MRMRFRNPFRLHRHGESSEKSGAAQDARRARLGNSSGSYRRKESVIQDNSSGNNLTDKIKLIFSPNLAKISPEPKEKKQSNAEKQTPSVRQEERIVQENAVPQKELVVQENAVSQEKPLPRPRKVKNAPIAQSQKAQEIPLVRQEIRPKEQLDVKEQKRSHPPSSPRPEKLKNALPVQPQKAQEIAPVLQKNIKPQKAPLAWEVASQVLGSSGVLGEETYIKRTEIFYNIFGTKTPGINPEFNENSPIGVEGGISPAEFTKVILHAVNPIKFKEKSFTRDEVKKCWDCIENAVNLLLREKEIGNPSVFPRLTDVIDILIKFNEKSPLEKRLAAEKKLNIISEIGNGVDCSTPVGNGPEEISCKKIRDAYVKVILPQHPQLTGILREGSRDQKALAVIEQQVNDAIKQATPGHAKSSMHRV